MDKINKTYTAPQAVFEPCDPARYLMAGSEATASGSGTGGSQGDKPPGRGGRARMAVFDNDIDDMDKQPEFQFTLDDF